MVIFEDIQDVEDWLAPVDYLAFWEAVTPYSLFEEGERAHYDSVIAGNVSPQETVLYCLKAAARVALTERFDLNHRIFEPVDAQYLTSTH